MCKVFDVHKDARNVLVAKVVNAEAKDNIDYVIMALCEAVMLRIAMCSLAVYWIFIYVLAIFLTTQLRAWHVTLTVKCLPHKERPTCGTCADGKQRRENQSRKETGRKAPIKQVGGIISGINGPITSADRLGNRYMINFVDHRSYYCRVFLPRT